MHQLYADPGVWEHFPSLRHTGRHVTFLARWPTSKAMQRARDRLKELTDRSRLQLPIKELVDDMNRFLRGWSAYFRFGNSTLLFEKLISFARMRVVIVVSGHHQRSRAWGRSVVFFQSPNHFGLITIAETVAAPRPFRAWRRALNAGGERRR